MIEACGKILPRTALICILIAFCVLPTMICRAAFPLGADSGKVDLILCSSYWHDRSPCYVEWYQFNEDGSFFDSRVIRKSNETWTDASVADFDKNGVPELMISVDNDKGFSAVYQFHIDLLGTLGNQKLTCFLPNEAWRHYSAISLGNFDGDRNLDVLTLNFDRKGKTVLEWFEFDSHGKVIAEKVLTKLSPMCGEGVALGDIDDRGQVDVFVLKPCDYKGRENKILKFRFDVKGKLLSGKRDWCKIPASEGMLTGLTIRRGANKEKTLFACAHKVRMKPAEKGTMQKGKYLAETNYLLPATDIENDAGRVFKIPINADGDAGAWSVWVDWIYGRNWRGIALVPHLQDSTAKLKSKFSTAKRTQNAKRNVLHLKGLMGSYYRINEAISLLGGSLTEYGYDGLELRSGLKGSFSGYEELLKYDLVVLSDLPLWAFNYDQLLMFEAYVRAGGKLIVFGGLVSGSNGGYQGSPLEKLLPCDVGTRFNVEILEKPIALKAGQAGYVYSFSKVGPKRPDSVVKLGFDGDPILLERKLGHGSVSYFLGLPFGKDCTDKQGFWNAGDWPKYLVTEIMDEKF